MLLFVPHDLLKVLSSYFIDGSHPNEAVFFFSNGQRPKRVRQTERERESGREVEYIHTYMSRVRERTIKKSSSSND